MPVVCFAAAEHLGAVHVPGGQVGQRAAAVVLVLDAHRPAGAGGCGGVLADAGLDGGLLVGGDDELVGPQRRVVEAAGVEVEHPGRLGSEVGVAGEDPGPVLPGLDRIGGLSQRQIVVPEIEATMPARRRRGPDRGTASEPAARRPSPAVRRPAP